MSRLAKPRAQLFACLFAVAWLFSAGSTAAEEGGKTRALSLDDKTEWGLRLPAEENVLYQGVSSFDQVGVGGSSFLYPAPNAIGLLAAIVAHGIVVGTARSSQKTKIQEEADKILLPYRGVLDGFRYRELMQNALARIPNGATARLVEPAVSQGRELLVESVPVFSMTQDQFALVVDNLVVISAPDAAPESAYRNAIRVVAAAHEEADPVSFWSAGNGGKIKDESARLLADSLNIALADYVAGPKQDELPYRTIRYREGSLEKMERAQVLSQACDRLLIRTLRGALMSVPVTRTTIQAAAADRCS